MTLTVRARVRNALVAAAALLGGAGVVVVASLNSPANNLDLDCSPQLVDGGIVRDSPFRCRAIIEPEKNAPPDQCAALLATGGEPPGAGLDAGFPNARVRVERALEAMRTAAVPVIDDWHVEPVTLDGGPSCWGEIGCHAVLTSAGKIDGNCAGLHDALDAQGAGSIFKPGGVSRRPAYALHGGCRAHVMAGEDPCAGSVGFDGGPEPDGGP